MKLVKILLGLLVALVVVAIALPFLIPMESYKAEQIRGEMIGRKGIRRRYWELSPGS